MYDDDDDNEAFTDIDEVDWSRIDDLAEQMSVIEAIDDPVERKAAAKRWAQLLEGGR